MAEANRDFSDLLDELLTEAAVEEEAVPASGSVDFLSVVNELHSGRIVITKDQLASVYEAGSEPVAPEAPAEPVLVIPSTDPADVSLELGIVPAMSRGALDAIRRKFAFDNHPDRVAPQLREVAMQRMQIANMLIDEAKAASTT